MFLCFSSNCHSIANDVCFNNPKMQTQSETPTWAMLGYFLAQIFHQRRSSSLVLQHRLKWLFEKCSWWNFIRSSGTFFTSSGTWSNKTNIWKLMFQTKFETCYWCIKPKCKRSFPFDYLAHVTKTQSLFGNNIWNRLSSCNRYI